VSSAFDAAQEARVRVFFTNHKAAIVPPVPKDSVQVKVGSPVPDSVRLFPLPAAIFDGVPGSPEYLYFVWGNSIVVADVETRVVVAIIAAAA
jgi:hypothetical protein